MGKSIINIIIQATTTGVDAGSRRCMANPRWTEDLGVMADASLPEVNYIFCME